MAKSKVIILSGASVDGKVSVAQGVSSKNFGKAITRKMFSPIIELRSWCDIVIVGRQTILLDNPSLASHLKPGASRGIIDRFLQLDYQSGLSVINKDFPLFVFTTKKPDRNLTTDNNIKFVVLGENNFFAKLKKYLNKIGIHKILFEAGGNLSALLLKNNIVDEICFAFFPFVIGGAAPTLCDGAGVEKIEDRVSLKLISSKEIDGMIQVKYKIKK